MPFQRPYPYPSSSPPHHPPKITLHYRFNILAITLSVLLTLLLSTLSTVLWVLLGFPGNRVGASNHLGGAKHGRLEWGWRADAQDRVLTGLVLGVLVFLLGAMADVAWVLGSWVLL